MQILDDKDKYICTICRNARSKTSSGKWYNLEGHLVSVGHVTNSKKIQQSQDIVAEEEESRRRTAATITLNSTNQLTASNTETVSPPLCPDKKIEMTLSFTRFILENRLPFSIIEPLVRFVSRATEECRPSDLQKFACSRQSVSKAASAISDTLRENLYQRLRDSPFSLSVDKSSDLYGSTYLAVCARFLDPSNPEHPTTKLIATIPVGTKSTGEVLYNQLLDKVFIDSKIGENIMGICTDAEPNMVGPAQGMCSRLQQRYPYLIKVKDFSHLFNKVFEKGLKGFPKSVTELVSAISSHFSYSNQRVAVLKEIQRQNNLTEADVTTYVNTRWLSMRDTLQRILDIWPSLRLYFEKHGTKKEKTYCSTFNETFLRTLYLLVNQINGYNEFFQSEDLFYNDVLDKIHEAFVVFFNAIIKRDHINTSFEDLYALPLDQAKDKYLVSGESEIYQHSLMKSSDQFENEYLLNYESIAELWPGITLDQRREVVTAARRFLFLAIKHMKTRLPYKEQIWEDISVVFFTEFNKQKWSNLRSRFTNILCTNKLKENFVDEVNRLEYNFKRIQHQSLVAKPSPLVLWQSLEKEYPTLSRLSRALLPSRALISPSLLSPPSRAQLSLSRL